MASSTQLLGLVRCEAADRIGYITLNRPEKRNALNPQMVSELKDAFLWAQLDDSVKVIVLKGEGEVFCAGADLAYLQQLQENSYQENLADSEHLKELFEQIYTHPKPIIAQVNGHAIAGGCGLATVCDFVFSVPEAKFGYTEVKIGFVPAIVMLFLLRKIGESQAKYLLLSGELIAAELAERMGFVHQVVPADALEAHVAVFADRLCKHNSAQAMTATKKMIAELQHMAHGEALQFAAEQNARSRATDDCKRGIAAFLAKEKLAW